MDDQRTDREGCCMNWLTKQRQSRFGLRSLLIAFAMIALCASAYLVGRELGIKEGFNLGYWRGKLAADDGLKTQVKEASDHWNRYASELQKAEREIEVLKFYAKKGQ